MPTALSHKKLAANTLMYFRIKGSTTNTDYRLLRSAKGFELTQGKAIEEIDVTTFDAVGGVQETIRSEIREQGTFSVDVHVNLAKSLTAVNGGDALNGLHAELFAAAGKNTEYEVALVMAKTGTPITALPDTPPTDRVFMIFNCRVTEFPIKGEFGGIYETSVTFAVTSEVALTNVTA